MPHRTIKVTRKELKAWGLFWSRAGLHSSTPGLMAVFIDSQKSATVKHRRKIKNRSKGQDRHAMCRGAFVSHEATATETRSGKRRDLADDMFGPLNHDINELDKFINTLRPECKKALADKYIRRVLITSEFWLTKGEQAVMLR